MLIKNCEEWVKIDLALSNERHLEICFSKKKKENNLFSKKENNCIFQKKISQTAQKGHNFTCCNCTRIGSGSIIVPL